MKKYKHFKGGIYTFLFEALQENTNEILVIYKNEKGEIFARPKDEFFGYVELNNEEIKRFKEID